MIRISLRDLQWRRRRFVIVVLVAALAFGLALVMSGVTHRLSQEGVTTVEMFDADHWVVAEGVHGPFTTSQLIDRAVADELAARPGVTAASPILIGRTIVGERDVNVVGYDPDSPILPDKLAEALRRVEIPTSAYARLLVVALVMGVLASLAGVRKITRVPPALAFGGAP